jgi:ring-1,2-phenylacetyl-CoA epoxidase subunit PaaD
MTKEEVYSLLETVCDPEVPVLTILDLGIVRDVLISDIQPREIKVLITPTYSGCPAMDVISTGIRMALAGRDGYKVVVAYQTNPPWTTDWMSEQGKQKLKEYGIAPPQRKSANELALFQQDEVPCPRCNSSHTELVSNFGPTSCKALYRCLDCFEPFEHFKCH